MDKQHLGILGATSLVGQPLLSLTSGLQHRVDAFSRTPPEVASSNIHWHTLPQHPSGYSPNSDLHIPLWINLAPIWVLPDYFDLLLKHKARRIVAVSSTSVYTKEESPDQDERSLAEQLADGEHRLKQWARHNDIEWVILRPTLIYGHGRDANIASIAQLIRRFSFFPIFGPAGGMRQPIRADDVAKACLMALQTGPAANCSYNISGAETLTYQNMLERIFKALNKKPRYFPIPLALFKVAIFIVNLLSRKQRWTAAMAYRMNQDLVFDHTQATRAFGFQPEPFLLSPEDIVR